MLQYVTMLREKKEKTKYKKRRLSQQTRRNKEWVVRGRRWLKTEVILLVRILRPPSAFNFYLILFFKIKIPSNFKMVKSKVKIYKGH